MTHQRLHSILPDTTESFRSKLTRNSKEVKAESVDFTVCAHYGIDTSDYSLTCVASWSQGKDTPEMKASGDTTRWIARTKSKKNARQL